MGELLIKMPKKEIQEEVFEPYKIGEYTLKQSLTSNKSGFSKWGFCEKNGKEFFIKEFLNPVYPLESIKLEAEVRQKKIKECKEWFNDKKLIYKNIVAAQTGNLVPPIELFRHESHFYLITDKVTEVSMDCKEISNIDMEHKLILMKVLANSFTKLAENNVVHADLKLDNLLIKQTNAGFFTIKVIDFDASYLSKSPPFGEEIQGDLVYLAPETFLAMMEEPVVLSPKVDVFAMGIIFHQLLCGEVPGFDSEYDYVYEAVLNDAELFFNIEIPEKYRKLIFGMLRKEPEERFSMHQVLITLKNIEKDIKFESKKADKLESKTSETIKVKSRWSVAEDFD